MKKIYVSFIALTFFGVTNLNAQLGPNLLGAKGTFSAPFVTPNPNAAACTQTEDGVPSYRPKDNIGNKLENLDDSNLPGTPRSAYTYVFESNGLLPEYTYTIIKNIGDANGGNCIKWDWRAQDHTGDGGWFMAVNGAPSSNPQYSRIFYRIEDITVCPGTEYQFGAWVINLLPGTSPAALPGSEPDISFVVKSSNGQIDTIARSGKIGYQNTPEWKAVTGTFTAAAGVTSVTLEVVNSTTVAAGNDLGLDDISLRVTQSNITLDGADEKWCVGTNPKITFTVHDNSRTNSWYKWQVSTDGGATFTDSTAPAQATFVGTEGNYYYNLELNITNVQESMNGRIYRLVAATAEDAFGNSTCALYDQSYTVVATACGPTPVDLMNFNARYNNGQVTLDWQTAQEINSDKFEVYRSADGQNYSLIGSVKSAGNSSIVKSYSFADANPGNGGYAYYKLKQIDIDGRFMFTSVARVNLGTAQATLQVYPNPFASHFTLSFSATKNADATLILRNSIGQPVLQKLIKTVKGNNTVDISNLPALHPGVYYATIHNEELNFNIKLQKQ